MSAFVYLPRRVRLAAVVGVALLGACSAEPAPRTASEAADTAAPAPAQAPSTPTVDLVDPSIPPAVAGEDGWNYAQRAVADLDGDGSEERVVITARVELYRGRPAWDDGQPWQVYVEEEHDSRTYLYARRLQLGTLTMRVGLGGDGRSPSVILLEQLPDRLGLYEVAYEGPQRAEAVVRFERAVDPRGDPASPTLP